MAGVLAQGEGVDAPIGGLGTGAVVSLIGAPGALIVAGGLALIATAYAATRWRSIL